jgi:phosphohistidine phosphatase
VFSEARVIYLVHHAPALGPEVDPQRPLSAEGAAHAERLAAAGRAAGVAPALIWHSGKLRARQTAEAFLRQCNPFAAFRMVRGLRPEDAPELVGSAMAAETADLLVVSHMPLLPALAHLLCPAITDFPVHGLLALERDEAGRHSERFRLSGSL